MDCETLDIDLGPTRKITRYELRSGNNATKFARINRLLSSSMAFPSCWTVLLRHLYFWLPILEASNAVALVVCKSFNAPYGPLLALSKTWIWLRALGFWSSSIWTSWDIQLQAITMRDLRWWRKQLQVGLAGRVTAMTKVTSVYIY